MLKISIWSSVAAIALMGCGQELNPGVDVGGFALLDSQEQGLEELHASSDGVEDSEAQAGPSTFLPGDSNFDRPDSRPELEEEEVPAEPVPELDIEQISLSWYSTNGLAISYNGDSGMLGMSGGNSCEYNPGGGYLSGADFSLQDCPDVPVEYDEQGRLMYRCNDELGFWSSSGNSEFVIAGLVTAEATREGFVTLEDAEYCQVSRRDHEGAVASVEVPSALCEDGTIVQYDEDDDIVYLGNGDVYAVTVDGYRLIGEGVGNLMAFDAAHDAIVVAWAGETTLGALNMAGDLLWKVESAAPVQKLMPMGETGAVFAWEYVDTSSPGSFVAYDGQQGVVWGEGVAWDGINDISVAGDGSRLMVGVGGSVYTYDLNVSE
jgi:hypothetical protein